MSNKLLAILGAIFAGIAGFINWLATVPPEQQSGMLATLVEIVPLEWRPTVGVWTRFIMFFLGIFATYKASKSGPAATALILALFLPTFLVGCAIDPVTGKQYWDAKATAQVISVAADAWQKPRPTPTPYPSQNPYDGAPYVGPGL